MSFISRLKFYLSPFLSVNANFWVHSPMKKRIHSITFELMEINGRSQWLWLRWIFLRKKSCPIEIGQLKLYVF